MKAPPFLLGYSKLNTQQKEQQMNNWITPTMALTQIFDTVDHAREQQIDDIECFHTTYNWIREVSQQIHPAMDAASFVIYTADSMPPLYQIYGFLANTMISNHHIRYAFLIYRFPWPDNILGRMTINSNLNLRQHQRHVASNETLPVPRTIDDFDMLYWQHLANTPIETAPEQDIQFNHFPITFRFQYEDQDEVLL